MTAISGFLSVDVEVLPGEHFTLPPTLAQSIGPGQWRITVEPITPGEQPIRDHSAFLSGYAAEDEGLYDDDSSR